MVEAAASAKRCSKPTHGSRPTKHGLVEAAGIEPASGKAATTVTTCVVRGGISSPCPPRTECIGDQPGSFSRLSPRHCLGASSQSMTPTLQPWKPNWRGRVL